MINPEDEVIPNLNTSCTVDEAIAKMLGWLQGPIRKGIINIDEYGIPENEMPTLPALQCSLEEHLMEFRNAARQEFFKALEAFDSAKEDSEKYAEVERMELEVNKCDKLLADAYKYKVAIEEEISKKESSLVIDEQTTKQTGTVYIKIHSLVNWAYEEYGICIDPVLILQPESENHAVEEKWSTETSKQTFYTTFAFLLEAFAETSKEFQKSNGEPNHEEIAKHLQQRAQMANNNILLTGQKVETIRKNIGKIMSDSIEIKWLTLRNRGEGGKLPKP